MIIEGFTPASAAAGGALIGLAAVTLMAANGRIAGISGIVGGALGMIGGDGRGDLGWRLAFIAGLMLAPFFVMAFGSAPIAFETPHPLWMMTLGGLFVGYGTRLGSGCTSGHGVCGVARLSKRSLVATSTFMATAIVTVFIVDHLFGG